MIIFPTVRLRCKRTVGSEKAQVEILPCGMAAGGSDIAG